MLLHCRRQFARLIAAWLQRLTQTFASLCIASEAASAVEFAMLLPLMIIIYIGTAELTQGVQASRDVDILSRTVADLVSQQSTQSVTPFTAAPNQSQGVSNSTVSTIFTASTAIMAPLSTTTLKITVSAIDIGVPSGGTCCTAKVRWSWTQNGTLRPCNTALSQVGNGAAPATTNIPSALVPTSASGAPQYVIIADVSYTYTPGFGPAIVNWTNGMSRTIYMKPRNAGQVVLASTSGAATGQSGQICF